MKGVDEQQAEEILRKWKDAFVELVNREGERMGSSKMMTLTKGKYQQQVDHLSVFKSRTSMLGCLLTVSTIFEVLQKIPYFQNIFIGGL